MENLPPKTLRQEQIEELGRNIGRTIKAISDKQIYGREIQQSLHDQALLEAREMLDPIVEPLPGEVDLTEIESND